MDFLNSPLDHYEFDDSGKFTLRNDWPTLLETGRDVRRDTVIAEIAETFPAHPLEVVYHELHKDEIYWDDRRK